MEGLDEAALLDQFGGNVAINIKMNNLQQITHFIYNAGRAAKIETRIHISGVVDVAPMGSVGSP